MMSYRRQLGSSSSGDAVKDLRQEMIESGHRPARARRRPARHILDYRSEVLWPLKATGEVTGLILFVDMAFAFDSGATFSGT